jgi:hypothetical protein
VYAVATLDSTTLVATAKPPPENSNPAAMTIVAASGERREPFSFLLSDINCFLYFKT